MLAFLFQSDDEKVKKNIHCFLNVGRVVQARSSYGGRRSKSEAEEQETAEEAKVARVVVESVGGGQHQPHSVALL